jgi:hypothetical protein
MGLAVSPEASTTMRLSVSPGLGGRNCRLVCRPGRVDLEGGSAAGLWAALAWLEWEMRTRRGPLLPEGVFTRGAAWTHQISQGPWGGNYSVPDLGVEYLSDESFALYAHYGVTEMMIYGDLLCYVHSDVLGELNHPDYRRHMDVLAEASARAARYGVGFCYVPIGPKLRADHPLFARLPEVRGTGRATPSGERNVHNLCTRNPLVRQFYRETFGDLFKRAPQLAGVVLIVANESMYHCRMNWGSDGMRDPCPVCSAVTTEEIAAGIAGDVRDGLDDAGSDGYVAAWPYTVDAGWRDPSRRELVRRLPQRTSLFLAIEKDQAYAKQGYTKNIWDYSIDFTGPSDIMRDLAVEAKQVGRELMVKTETGIGLEVFQFPYVPAMRHLADKWQKVRQLGPEGVHQSWLFFGMFGSRAEELGLWAAYRPDMPAEEFLRKMAGRDFGPAAADEVIRAWDEMCHAVRRLPVMMLSNYYVGPNFLGPCHPLIADKTRPVPDAFHAYLFYLQEGEETFSRRPLEQARVCLALTDLPATARYIGIEFDGKGDGWDVVLSEYRQAVNHAYSSWKSLQAAGGAVRTNADRANLDEEMLLTELVYRTFRATRNTLEFLLARRDLDAESPTAGDEMRRVARDERENALESLAIYEKAPWLDPSMRLDGFYRPAAEMIREKLDMIDNCSFLPSPLRGKTEV